MPLLFLLLALLTVPAHGAEQDAPPAAAPTEPAAAGNAPQDTNQPPPSADQLLRLDWQSNPASKTIEQEQVLFAEHTSGTYLGLVILLPEWQGTGRLWQLSATLTSQGFDTLLILPRFAQPQLNPAGEKKDAARDTFRQDLAARIKSLSEAKQQEGGFRLILAQGTAAAWASNLIASEQLPPPDALVLLDAYFPEQGANTVLAKDVAQSQAPILDLYEESAAGWPLVAAEARRVESRRSNKLNYRPYALLEQAELPARLQGWLRHLGWL